MSVTGERRRARPRSAIAIVAGICMFLAIFAIFGSWSMQSARATAVPPQPVVTSVSVVHADRGHPGHSSSATVRTAVSSTGLHQYRLPAPSHSRSPSWWSPTPDSLNSSPPIVWYRVGGSAAPMPATARAPATVLAGHDLLIQLCVNRR